MAGQYSAPSSRPGGPRPYDGEQSADINRKKSLVRPERSRMVPGNPQYHYAQAVTQRGSRMRIQPSTTGHDPAVFQERVIPLQNVPPVMESHDEHDDPYDSTYEYQGPRDVYGLNDEDPDAIRRASEEVTHDVGPHGDPYMSHRDAYDETNLSDEKTQVSTPLTGTLDDHFGDPEKSEIANRHAGFAPSSPPQPARAPFQPRDKILSPWYAYCQIVTFWAPSFILKLFGMKTKDRQRAWREKIGLITIIIYALAFVGYLTFGFTQSVCGNQGIRIRNGQVSSSYMIINGIAYDLSHSTHAPAIGVPQSNILYPPVNAGGMDGSFLFQNVNGHCKGLISPTEGSKIIHSGDNMGWYFPCQVFAQNGTSRPNFTTNHYEGWACHTSSKARKALYGLKKSGRVYFDWGEIKNATRHMVVYNGDVLDLTLLDWLIKDQMTYPEEFDLLRNDDNLKGVDISQFMAHGRDRQIARCLSEIIKVGTIDSDTIGCIASQVVLYISLVFILGLVAAKFFLACYFKFFIAGKQGAYYMTRKQLDAHNEQIEDWSENIYSAAPVRTVANGYRGSRYGAPRFQRESITMLSQIPVTTTSKLVPGNASIYNHRATGSRSSLMLIDDRNPDSASHGFDEDGYENSSYMGTSGTHADYLVPQPPVGYQPFGYPLAHIICLVTAYTESTEGLRTTLDSVATTDYPNSHKLIFVVCDGLVKGAGNEMNTPDICLSMMKDFAELPEDVQAFSYVSVVTGSKRHNMAKIYAGFYDYDNSTVDPSKQQRVPMILVVKCGTPAEASMPKPGNRGKRDSQIILMSFLQRVMFDDRMTELEYEIFNGIWKVTGIAPDFYEMILMVDADTKVFPDSLTHMVASMVKDPEIMGLCGETKIANKTQSWVTMIQVFEYFISHHQAKAFESVFGGVTCLPGCFSIYRIKAPKGDDGYWVPILANPDIVERYSDNVIDTLHKKNLLLLGEDRFLTTLMLRTFPKRKQVFVPKAACKTVVPDKFSVLLSQRRRWINSTVHNLMELVLVRDLCGVFCISMQFVVFVDLVSTLVLPGAITFTLYVVVIATYKKPTPVLSLVLLALILGLPGLLIVVTASRVSYVGWMLIYLLALPIWNFVLPMYAYWKFDDFSWGDTRSVSGGDKGGHDDAQGEFDSSKIVMKRWREFQREKQRAEQDGYSRTMSLLSSASYMRPASRTSYADNTAEFRQEESNLL